MIKILLIISAFIPILGLLGKPPDTMLLIYSFFVLAYLFKDYFRTKFSRRPLKFFLLIVLTGLFAEVLAWLNNYLAKRPDPALFHPQLFFDLLIGLSQYGAWALALVILTKKFKYSLWELFILLGIYGVVLEQKGMIFIQGLTHMPLGLLMWAYIFVVYGSIIALAFVLAGNKVELVKSNSWIKYPTALVFIMALGFTMMFGWGSLLNILGVIPKPSPIWERPFF